MTTLLRLDPARELLWRDDTTVQLGVIHPLLIENPSPWQQELLHALVAGVPETEVDRVALVCGTEPSIARSFLTDIDAALEARGAPVPVIVGHDVWTLGDAAEVFLDAIEGEGAVFAEHGTTDAISLVVTAHVLTPQATSAWMSADRTHLPVVFDAAGVTVGPVIVPGETACAGCLAIEARERDPAWPMLAAQLVGRRLDPPTPALVCEAAALIVRMLDAFDANDPVTRSVSSGRGLRRSWRTHRPSADCDCRFPAGSGTVLAMPDRSRVTTTTTTYARPA